MNIFKTHHLVQSNIRFRHEKRNGTFHILPCACVCVWRAPVRVCRRVCAGRMCVRAC